MKTLNLAHFANQVISVCHGLVGKSQSFREGRFNGAADCILKDLKVRWYCTFKGVKVPTHHAVASPDGVQVL